MEKMYDRLHDFVVQHGHSDVPIKYEEDIQLSQWVYKQRIMFANGLMSGERKHRLDDLGFSFLGRLG